MDQGLDRLPFFSLLLLLWSSVAGATSFGPMRVSEQIKNSDYFVRGTVVGSSWVLAERKSQRPYTYWKLQVTGQAGGAPLGTEVDIRQPGGEIGELGYHVAGSASFREGEDVLVVLRDTDETAKEVVSLMSGKYTVENGEGGKPLVRSAFGAVMRSPEGRPYSPDEFLDLARRFTKGTATPAELGLYLNENLAHDHDPAVDARENEARAVLRGMKGEPKPGGPGIGGAGSGAVATTATVTSTDAHAPESSAQERAPETEEPKGSSYRWWITFGLVALAFALFRIRPRR